jgi:hypothetical protein
MNARYVSIAATALAALVMGIGPATAQTSATDSQSTPGGPHASPSTGTHDSSTPSASPSGAHTNDANTNGDGKRDTDVKSDTNNDSPSASPRGDDGTSKGDDSRDRQKMKEHEQIDKKSGMDRG